MPTPPDPALVDPFARTLRGLTILFMRVAAEQSTTHGSMSKQELLALDVLGVRGPSRMGEIAEHLGVGQSAVTPIVDRLEAQGAVRRHRSETDRRVWLAELTPDGEALFEAESAAYQHLAVAMLKPLEPGERETLLQLLDRIQASLNDD